MFRAIFSYLLNCLCLIVVVEICPATSFCKFIQLLLIMEIFLTTIILNIAHLRKRLVIQVTFMAF